MGVKLMTGATGEQNIQAADDRECLAGITGLDSYIFPTGSQLKATLVDANTITIGTGAGSLQGSRFRCSTTTTVTIQSGTQGQFRRDVIGLHFSRETSGREGLEFQVLTGEPASSEGAVADPTYTAGDLLKGDAEAFMPLYRVKLSGINAADPEPLFSVLTPLADLGDSVSPTIVPSGGWSYIKFGRLAICYGEFSLDNVNVTARWADGGVTYGYYSTNISLPDFPVGYREPPSMRLSVSYVDPASDDPGIAVFNPRSWSGKKCQTFYFTRPTPAVSGHPNVNVTAIGLLKK